MEKENIFRRFVDILKPDFLAKNFNDIESNKTWRFWFLSNSIIAIILVVVAGFGITVAVNEAGSYMQEKYPDAKISITDGKLSTSGINEPLFIESKEDNSVLVVDTQGAKYDESVLNDFKKGTFVSSSKIYSKESEFKTEQFDISKVKENFVISQQDLQDKKWVASVFFIVTVFIFTWFYLNILRLVSALWWTLWFWLLGLILKVENITFSKVYYSMLNFYIIPLTISLTMLIFGLHIPFLTFIIFAILFAINYLKLNKQRKEQTPPVAEPPQEIK